MEDGFDLTYAIRETRLGPLLIAATRTGVCFVRFGADRDELESALSDEFPFADAQPGGERVAKMSEAIADYVDGRSTEVGVPLDVRGSCFQRRVWKELAAIPRGETRSYSDVARAVGLPRGARAVARACASNPVPVVVPCHRVVEQGGRVGGYNGGAHRKLCLLRNEGAIGSKSRQDSWRAVR
jgi:AraC family transcriptional regulator of adaptative response/methylated-DNA-[protein]-cysteine methyltransferase